MKAVPPGHAVTTIDPDREYVLYCDGASRGNPGLASAGFVLLDSSGAELAAEGEVIGRNTTNNVAEYTALLLGLETAARLGVQRLRVRMDSQLVVRQILGLYKVRHEGLRPLFARAQRLRRGFAHFAIEHVPREQNKRADALANEALDSLPSHE
jgi:ribonuclease HI